MAVGPPNPPAIIDDNTTRVHSSKFDKLSMNTLQMVQREKFRFNYLLECRKLKRPPPSLRCTGFSALNEEVRISMISDAETRALLKAIESKKKEIQLLENKLQKESSSENATFKGLSKRQKRWWKKHYKRKIVFYRTKEATDWLN